MSKISVVRGKASKAGRAAISIRDQVSAAEWETRVNLSACYRLVDRYRMTDVLGNHITARVPGDAEHFLINPYGLFYNEITASNLIKIDLEGNIVLKSDLPLGINYAGYVIHSAVHAARHDVRCVLHTHTRAGMAVSAMKCGLLPVTQTALRFYNALGIHDYEGPAVELGERKRLVRDLGRHNAMILRNHGLLTCGGSIAQAFLLMQRLETACQIQVDLMTAGAELVYPSKKVCEKSARLFAPPTAARNQGPDGKMQVMDGAFEWTAQLRMLDAVDPSYRN